MGQGGSRGAGEGGMGPEREARGRRGRRGAREGGVRPGR